MSLGYRLAYRVGFTPWTRKDDTSLRRLAALLDREEEGRTRPYGKALDLGCGTGTHTVDLARRGWDATGVDGVRRALVEARANAAAAGVAIELAEADVTELGPVVGTDFDLALDLGCFHGLTPEQRAMYAAGLDRVTKPGAVLLMFAFGPGRRGPMPRGVDRAGVEAAFTGWQITLDEPADVREMKGPPSRAEPRWFELVRGSGAAGRP